ncbi:hypothetical protein SCHPADRAFT_890813 [Schizopora paradoxa]|uniref:Uncharacterized protein n=1 Tax=Schizopora paradoxa TaxID=27342 RepID=A0A0H2RLI7_9AGAM|nr:hypothetical protein SCHPADRAFT_890813 [Schizopora paradoxa]
MSKSNKAFYDALQVFKAMSSLNPQFSIRLMPLQMHTGSFLAGAEITDKNQSPEKRAEYGVWCQGEEDAVIFCVTACYERLHECIKGNVDGFGQPGREIYKGTESPYARAMRILEAHPTFSPCILEMKKHLQ